ncbi:DUF1963 domain-containing protein [Coraliomargarita algicola]|uniref:DUF1963 domain-containing protein n=1 Tax=Coraliomargarita algicola TaxID=3092156 RepID=A0ABZ0RLS6_9BACT|nr:DUF1963 domain-containing protein [Coraliomargarita sp. J2-16]WPJ96053.1 DUF1963 domain-containing protein [Coraliomargarita sp. J2-16]
MNRQLIQFTKSKKPISEPETKFGGQPNWIEEVEWPLSRATGEPMRFICQIVLSPELFGESEAKVAYIFMTDGKDYVDGTWEPDGGENAVILQPGSTEVPTKKYTKGPTLYQMVKKMFQKRLQPEPCEFKVEGSISDEPDFIPIDQRSELSDSDFEAYARKLEGNKIGGSPIFLQNDEFPDSEPWDLLLQLDSTSVPFYVNFGDAGIGYAFISKDRKKARFLWQCA